MRSKAEPPDLVPARMAGFLGELLGEEAARPDAPTHPGLSAALADGYDARDRLGGGGAGEVWRGVDGNTGRAVAVKVRRLSGDTGDEAGDGAFEAEVRALHRLAHPGVVGLIRRGGRGGSEYLVLELVDGLPLDQFVRGRRPSAGGLLDLLQKVCDAVAAVHAAHLVHADLKPENILVREDGTPVLVDFGLACRPGGEGAAVARRVVRGGTELFLAPELRAAGGTPSRASDLYALAETFRRAAAAAGRAAPGDLTALLDEAGEDDASARLDSAAELARRLGRLRVPTSRPRRGRRAGGLVLVLALAAAAAGTSVFRGGPAANDPPGSASPGVAVSVAGVVARAQTLFYAGDREAALTELTGVPDADRGWEWRHLWAFGTRPPVVVSQTYPEPGTASVLGLDAESALVGTATGRLYRTDLDGGVTELFRGAGSIDHLAVLDDLRFAAVDRNGQVLIVDGAAVNPVARIAGRPTVCWPDTGPGDLLGWDSDAGNVSRIDLASGRSEVLGQAGLVLPAPSSPGWVWATDPLAEGPVIGQALMGPGWETHRREAWPLPALPASMDHDAERGRTVLGTFDGVLRYFDGPEEAPRSWNLSDRALTAVVLSEDERRVFAVGDALYVFDLDREAVVLRLPVDLPGIVTQVRWNADSAALTVATDRAMMQWRAPPADNLMASR